PYDLITSTTNWATDFGEVPCDTDITEKFLTDLSAGIDDEMLSYDHSASTFIPFVKYYLPNAKVSCLLISGRAEKQVPEKAANLLYDISREKNCLFLFSADFSHYLDPDTALRKDVETLAAITARDTAAIEHMNDDHTDTPRCLCTFILLMDLMEADITSLDRSDSAEQADLPYNHATFPEGVTSYFIFAGET
ncbi:MAG: AmmeMemoRadiSam system protein B, partial [Oscillospiraceae bacterium]|nr:AmmeMemoRadiSam system protein B [Oscillospiraceae bacterium]